jgi:predicted nucleic acid-binding Zn ribbon protein
VSRAEPIGRILAEVVRDLGLTKKLTEQRAVVEWSDIAGRGIAEHSRAIRVEGKKLFVEVESSVWAQELSLMKRRILGEIDTRIGKDVIENVHFVLGGSSAHRASGPGRGKE